MHEKYKEKLEVANAIAQEAAALHAQVRRRGKPPRLGKESRLGLQEDLKLPCLLLVPAELRVYIAK